MQRRNPVPIDFGSGPSEQIKHVVFILKENRTYDQVFGDWRAATAIPSLALFGEDDHAEPPRARRASSPWATTSSTTARCRSPATSGPIRRNTTDFTEKLWPRNYNGNLSALVVQFGQEGFAKDGYIFEALERAGVSYRVYGETFAFLTRFVAGIDGGGPKSLYPAAPRGLRRQPRRRRRRPARPV